MRCWRASGRRVLGPKQEPDFNPRPVADARRLGSLERRDETCQGLARLQDAEAGHPSLRLEAGTRRRELTRHEFFPAERFQAKVSESEAKEVKLEQDEFLMEVDTSKEKQSPYATLSLRRVRTSLESTSQSTR